MSIMTLIRVYLPRVDDDASAIVVPQAQHIMQSIDPSECSYAFLYENLVIQGE